MAPSEYEMLHQLVIAHEGSLAALAANVKNLASATEKMGNAMSGLNSTVTEMARLDRDEYVENRDKIEQLAHKADEWKREWEVTQKKVKESIQEYRDCLDALQSNVEHLGWLNKLIAFTGKHPTFEKTILLSIAFLAIHYFVEHSRSMLEFFWKVIRFTGWRPGL